MWKYYELVTDLTPDDILALRSRVAEGENPRNIKVDLAKLIIRDFHSANAAVYAEEEFNRRFVQKEIPDDIDEKEVAAGTYKLAELITSTGLAASKGEARRLIEQNGVKVNGEKASNANADITIGSEATLLQVGKRKFLKLVASEK
jgi:tyrosyl-tRNA synthetase